MPASQEIRNNGNRTTVSADPQLALGHNIDRPRIDVHEGVLELLHQEATRTVRQPRPGMVLSNKLHMSPSRESAAAAPVEPQAGKRL